MTKSECDNYILDIPKFAGKNSNEDTLDILKKLIDIDALPSIIHVAGTNGKGSVCAFMQSILMESGYRVGMFISPHLIDMNERIQINKELIDDGAYVKAFEKVKAVISDSNHPSFFEYIFLMAMVYFSENDLDYIILETGLGGRLDATNCIPNKRLCIITEIGLDHMQYLGDSYEKIAYEKAGIIKASTKVVFTDKRSASTSVIENRCNEMSAKYVKVNADDITNIKQIVLDDYADGTLENNFSDKNGISFYFNSYKKLFELEIASTALYQCENASVAVSAAMFLEDPCITEECIKNGIRNMYWPGRMEQVANNVFVDGAHNEDGVKAMTDTVNLMKGEKTLLFAVVNDKDYQKMIEIIVNARCFSSVIITKAGHDRATDTQMIADIFMKQSMLRGQDIVIKQNENIFDAYEMCLGDKSTDSILIISGSLYLVGEVKQYLSTK